ncbi:hypothetical protein Sjap_018383 [Stephania japonica]|uniref:Uncharacterized protein n=1 Tax=Stephania japonica TaxID=461633 RepID=A0AAP0I7X3_9MAGN
MRLCVQAFAAALGVIFAEEGCQGILGEFGWIGLFGRELLLRQLNVDRFFCVWKIWWFFLFHL